MSLKGVNEGAYAYGCRYTGCCNSCTARCNIKRFVAERSLEAPAEEEPSIVVSLCHGSYRCCRSHSTSEAIHDDANGLCSLFILSARDLISDVS